MNLTFINKNINEQDRDADKEFQHGPRRLGPYEGIRVSAPDTPFDDIERKQRNQGKRYITDKQRGKVICRILGIQIIDES